MNIVRFIILIALHLILMVYPSSSVYAWLGATESLSTLRPTATDRLIVKLRKVPLGAQAMSVRQSALHQQLRTLSEFAQIQLTYSHAVSDGAVVVRLPQRISLAQAIAIAYRLSNEEDVLYAEPDVWMSLQSVPNDPRFVQQWNYFEDAGGIRLPEAWDITTGHPDVTVAVVDTGIVAHADLSGQIIQGFDFISDPVIANDGDGRDSDPSDPGDWITVTESNGPGPLEGCPVAKSTWHGTHVAGIIGAVTNNDLGVAGINWTVKLQPVRALGKCGGGFLSDIVDGMRWAAGISVPDVPDNPTPAQIINLSLGAPEACSLFFQEAVSDIVRLGKLVVVAAGNEGQDVSNVAPANCVGTVPVAATTRSGGKAYYSNFGGSVQISAPGGEQLFSDDPNGILSTVNSGQTTPEEDSYRFYQGTSMAAPHVSGVAALMLSANPNLGSAEILRQLKATARPFTDSSCNRFICGAGIVDASAAVRAVLPSALPTVDAGPDQTVNPGARVSLKGLAEDDGEIIGIEWSQTAGEKVALTGGDTLTPNFDAPLPAGRLTLLLTVTDNSGLKGSDRVDVIVNNLPPVPDPIGDKTVDEGGTVNFTVTASDPNGISPVLEAHGLPEGASFEATTGQFSWPQVGPVGDYRITFTAVDAQDGNLTKSTTVLIAVHARASGGGCSLGREGMFDPLLPGLLIFSLVYFVRRCRYN